MTAPDLRALVRAIAEAAAKCVGARPATVQHHVARNGPHFSDRTQSVTLAAQAGDWRVKVTERGPTIAAQSDALDAAAVLALRERLQAQRDERARLLAADDAALRVLDETARVYDAATYEAAVHDLAARFPPLTIAMWRETAENMGDCAPWSRRDLMRMTGAPAVATACDAILRRRAGGAP